MHCSSCGHENRAGRKFCARCGSALALLCPACGAANEHGDAFCGECGNALAAVAEAAQAVPALAAERRLVTVVFADLVGFTALSERRDAEDVRELLSRYFDLARRLIQLYGGTVEKFIGDAVMAVWGTPVATEDDAERAVRAALDVVDAVATLGQEVGLESLRARAGVLTGEAAVTVGARGEGMVAGDLVNTASRIQSTAAPGTVLVGDATRRATEATVVFEDAGVHELRGRDAPVALWRAVRVVSGARGSLKSERLEAPFVGRDRELRQIKAVFHASADQARAQLVSVTGVAGIGKSRLAWEFYKYFDGLAQIVYWHRGRCLAYGEGVTYWALADMVRMRCRIGEDEDAASALAKLGATLDEHLLDPEERRFVEPALAQLLGLRDEAVVDRQSLFAAWRLFFERLSGVYPTVLVFEDMHWADASLLDFVESLLEWSRAHPILVLTLARPELLDRRPSWGAGLRNFSSMHLEPLPERAMDALLTGLVPGLPAALHDEILVRAEGIPLYAVETVRMLLDRGALVQEGNAYRPVAEIGSLAVPETLHALIAARLDGLPAAERRLLQDASVLGKTFSRAALAGITGLAEDAAEPLLASLVRKEILVVQADPRSPEHGQYGFLQDLVRRVAYETLSRRERRARHLAAADHLLGTLAEEEVIEVVASHLLDAYRVAPDAEDAGVVRARALEALVRSGEHAAALAAAAEAARYFSQAAELVVDGVERAVLLERAGEMAWRAGHPDEARDALEVARTAFEAAGESHATARVVARLGEVEWARGRLDQALEQMEGAYAVLAGDEPDEDFAVLAAQLARLRFFHGDMPAASEHVDTALTIAEELGLPRVTADALATAAIVAIFRNRLETSLALLRHAADLAREHGFHATAIRAQINLVETLNRKDRYAEARTACEAALAMARRVGDRALEYQLLAQLVYPLTLLGDWDEALAALAAVPLPAAGDPLAGQYCSALVAIRLARGEVAEAHAVGDAFAAAAAASTDVQERGAGRGVQTALLRADGRHADALAAARRALDDVPLVGIGNEDVKDAYMDALEAAWALGDVAAVERLCAEIEAIPRGVQPRVVAGQAARFRGLLAAAAGDDGADELFRTGEATFRELGTPYYLAQVLVDHAAWLMQTGADAGAELAEARALLEPLRAAPLLERLDELELGERSAVPAGD